MKVSAGAILVTDKPWGVDIGNVAAIFSPADDLGYLHGAKKKKLPPPPKSLEGSLLCVAPGSQLSRIC